MKDDRDTLLANLTATQERCTALLEEARAARLERDAYKLAASIAAAELRDALDIIADFIELGLDDASESVKN